ncbi:MAG: restriction endonuclease [Patescibacteria group bacterium]
MKIQKAAGHYQPFDRDKFVSSLLKSGVPKRFVLHLSRQAERLEPKLRNTDQLFDFAHQELAQKDRKSAMRYSLKRAVFELGPTGFPFEQYVARLLDRLGYRTQTNVYVRGYCVSHEVDILAWKGKKTHLIECKFHSYRGIKTNVKIVLYVKARVEDIDRALVAGADTDRQAQPQKIDQAWLITNTKHTIEAEKYARCAGIHLVSWGYPAGAGLESLIEKTRLYPVTALLHLDRAFKKRLVSLGLVTAEDVVNFSQWNKVTPSEKNRIRELQKDGRLLLRNNE